MVAVRYLALGAVMSIFSLFGCGRSRTVTREAETLLASIPGTPLTLVSTDWTPSWAHADLNRYHILIGARDDAYAQIAVRWNGDVASSRRPPAGRGAGSRQPRGW